MRLSKMPSSWSSFQPKHDTCVNLLIVTLSTWLAEWVMYHIGGTDA